MEKNEQDELSVKHYLLFCHRFRRKKLQTTLLNKTCQKFYRKIWNFCVVCTYLPVNGIYSGSADLLLTMLMKCNYVAQLVSWMPSFRCSLSRKNMRCSAPSKYFDIYLYELNTPLILPLLYTKAKQTN